MRYYRFTLILLLIITSFLITPAIADDDLARVRVVDVGFGLCCIMDLPGDIDIVYDTGGESQRRIVEHHLADLVTDGVIEVLILSHPHGDHMGSHCELILHELDYDYEVLQLWRTGFNTYRTDQGIFVDERGKPTDQKELRDAVTKAEKLYEFEDLSFANRDLFEGFFYPIPDESETDGLTIITGQHEWPSQWNKWFKDRKKYDSKRVNSSSMVVRLDIFDTSVLFTGDAHGRIECSKTIEGAVKGADGKYYIEPAVTEHEMTPDEEDDYVDCEIDCDVLISPHHGSDGSSSQNFLNAVSPEWVIFSSGAGGVDHLMRHPRKFTVERCKEAGVPIQRMLRTDLGDKRKRKDVKSTEWIIERSSAGDNASDDHIDILIYSDGYYYAKYLRDEEYRFLGSSEPVELRMTDRFTYFPESD